MAESHEVSRPGNEQYLVVEHDGDTYEARKEQYQKEVDGELVQVEEYRLDRDDEDVPDPVVDEIDETNAELE